MPQTFADIILPVPIQRLFTYSIPQEMQQLIAVGSRVVVQFGRKKSYSGIVYRIHEVAPAEYDTKPILSVVDSTPIVVSKQLELWRWIADYYMCSLGEVYKAALPSGLKLESESHLIYNALYEPEDILPERQEQVLTFLRNKKACIISDLTKAFTDFNPLPQLRKLLEIEAVFINEELRDTYKPKTELCYLLSSEYRSEEAVNECLTKLERAPKQLEAFIALMQKVGGLGKMLNGTAASRAELTTDERVSAIALSELAKKGILATEKRSFDRLTNSDDSTAAPNPLNDEQQAAFDSITKQFGENKIVLLNGVTSSGKTEIYIHLIKRCLSEGKRALYLLPEIALTTQITSRLRKYFGNDLGVYHSKFSDSERVEVWNKLLKGEYKVVLGVRSSVLLPLENLGLIIVDEEHETSFKQFDPAPRYNARDVAVMLRQMHGANVLLGSATPSLESYYNAQTGKYGYVELTHRYAGVEMPEIIPVDMLAARRKHATFSHFSYELKEAIDEALAKKEQVILFQNRRGFSPYIECQQCAWIPKCQNCDVSLTYHKKSNTLVCHYCSYTVSLPQVCPACHMPSLEPQGFGTEMVEEDVKEIFPQAKVVRMDLDTARSRRQYEQIFSDFEQGKFDILIGTQMVSKGLDFKNVSTVGIMNADNLLNIPDFRAYERSFQQLSQVSGRAGRSGRRGRVFLQTRSVDNPVVSHVVNNDYKANVREQLAERERYHYPPFFRMMHITLKHKQQETVYAAASQLARMLTAEFGNRVAGPMEPTISRIATYYLQRLTIRFERKFQPQMVKKIIMDRVNSVVGDQRFRSVVVQIDVDPY